MCFLGNPERWPSTLNSNLFIRVRVDWDTVVVRLISQQTATTLQNRPFLVALARLFRSKVSLRRKSKIGKIGFTQYNASFMSVRTSQR